MNASTTLPTSNTIATCQRRRPGQSARGLALFALAALLAPALAGCNVQEQRVQELANNIVLPAAVPYARAERMTMDAGRLKRQGRLQEDLRIPGSEGTQIAVWVLSPRGKAATRGTVVLLHPLETSKMWLFSHAETLAERGWYVVLLDLPGHGMSDGAYITWGVKEKYDVSVVVDALLAGGKIRHPLFAAGTSFGGMVALQYAALDSRCRGVLAISAPIDCPTVARRILMLATEADYRAALVRAGVIANFDPQEASSLKAAARMKCPMILVHGRLDAIVPYDWSEKILAAHRGPKRLITLPFDGHTPEVMRERWLADRIEELAAMAAPDQTDPPKPPR